MAVQGRGYYGIGAAKKDFGFSKNMTLPLSGGYDWSQADPMPTEGRSGKGQGSFTVDKKGQLVEYRNEKKGKSWRSRLSGFFKREKNAKETEESGKSDANSVKATAKSKTKASEEPNLKEDGAKAGAQPEDDVNNAILNQEGLTTAEDEEQEENEEGGEQEDEDDDSDMVVAAEVKVEYHGESGDEDHSQVSPTEAQELEDIDPDMESNSLMLPAAEVQDDEEEIGDELEPEPLEEENENAEYYNEDITRDEVEPEPLEEEDEKIDQNTSIEPDPPVEKIPPKQKKKKKKSENRKSAALDVAVSEQEGKKNGKTKKQRPKSMPEPTLDLANEQEVSTNADTSIPPPEDSKKSKARQQKGATARTNGQDIQEATTTLTETQPEIKKGKAKKGSGKKGAGVNDKASTESPVDTTKNGKAKKKSAPSEQTFDSPLTSGSPPPEEEIQVPKQVTVGVIKKKKQKTRPFLEVSKNPRSEVYQSDPAQEDDIEDPDAEEQELLHEMDTLQLMVGEETAKSKDKKAKKKKQGEGWRTQDTTESPAEVTKAAKKSKQAKGKGKSVAEPEPMVPQTEVATKESKEEKGSRVAKKTRAKGKIEPQIEPKIQPSPPQPEIAAESEKPKKAKKSKSGGKSEQDHEPEGQQTEAASKKQPKKKAKSKDKDDVLQVSPPEAAPEPDKREAKKTKKTKSKGKSEPPEPEEAQPPLQEVVATATEPDKKQPAKVKKAKSKGKAAPEPEPEALSQSPPPTEPESGKKRSSKKSKEAKGKGKTDTTNAPKAAAAENSQEESETPKKKKKKISKATPESPSIQNSGSSSARTSRSQLATKTSKSKIASEASDDLEWVGPEKLSKKMSESEFKSKDDSAVDEVLMEMDRSISSSRSTSYHELSKDDRKTFQEELRKASSQHSVDAADDVEGSVKVEIDPNVKVTKSGVVKAGGKGSRRPSLQMQVFEGGIEQTDSASPNEADKESSKKISMDLSAVPQTTPSLGLAHGHDKVDLFHRSSVKRRPMSQRETTLLTEDQQNTNGSGAGLNSGQGTPTSVARQLFSRSDGEPQNGAGSATSTLERARRNKTVDKPVKMLGIASDSSAAKSVSDPSVPSWVALAKNKQKRSSQLLADKKEVSSSIPAFSPTPVQSSSMAASRQSTPRDKDDSIPKMGTVQARLAAFQRK